MQITSCLNCHARVVIPGGTPDAAVVRCPICSAEYELAEALAKALPHFIVVSLPPSVEPALEAHESLATPPTISPFEESSFEESPRAAAAPESWATAEPLSLSPRTVAVHKRAPRGGVLQAAGVIVGGLMAIPLAQLVLWWLPGSWGRDFGLGPRVARVSVLRWMVPQQFRDEASSAEDAPEAVALAHAAPEPPAAAHKPAEPEKEIAKNQEVAEKPAEPEKTEMPDDPPLSAVSQTEKPRPPDLPAKFVPESEAPASTPSKAPASSNEVTVSSPVAQRYVTALGETDEQLASSLRWWPAAARPVLGLRWGLGVTFLGWNNSPPLEDDESLEKFTAGLGTKLRDGLVSRMQAGAFRSGLAGTQESQARIPLAANSRSGLVEFARGRELDALLQIELDMKVTPGTGARDFLTKVRLIDVDGAPSGRNVWFSNERLLKDALLQQKNMQAFVNTVQAEIDEHFSLAPLPSLTREQVQARVEKIEPVTGLAALRTLTEVRYYHTKKLLDDATAEAAYEKLLGEGKGRPFATGTPQQRKLLAAGLFNGKSSAKTAKAASLP